MKDGEENFKLCRNCPRKLLIPIRGQFHFMPEPTIIYLLWVPALNEIAADDLIPAGNKT